MISRFNAHFHRSFAIGKLQTNIYGFINIFTYLFLLPILKRLGYLPKDAVWKCQKFGVEFKLYFDGAHGTLLTIYEILCLEEYDVELKNPKTIFDIGANIGLVSIFYATKYPEAQIYAFEPAPSTFEYLQRNTKQFPNVEIFNVALAGSDGPITFFVDEKKSIASSVVNRGGNTRSIEVIAWSFDKALQKTGITEVDLVKFDIEGAEYDLFKNVAEQTCIKHLTGEIHEDLMNQTKEDFLALFHHLDLEIKPANKTGRYIVNTKPII